MRRYEERGLMALDPDDVRLMWEATSEVQDPAMRLAIQQHVKGLMARVCASLGIPAPPLTPLTPPSPVSAPTGPASGVAPRTEATKDGGE
jgi:hypothetical protein